MNCVSFGVESAYGLVSYPSLHHVDWLQMGGEVQFEFDSKEEGMQSLSLAHAFIYGGVKEAGLLDKMQIQEDTTTPTVFRKQTGSGRALEQVSTGAFDLITCWSGTAIIFCTDLISARFWSRSLSTGV